MRENEFFARPMVIGAFLFIWGGMVYFFEHINNLMGLIICTCTVILIAISCGNKKSIILIVFLICGYLNIYIYFNMFLPHDVYDAGVIVNKNEWGMQIQIRGKKVATKNYRDLKLGDKIWIMGDFNREEDYIGGTVGRYKIYKYRVHGRSSEFYGHGLKEKIRNKIKTESTEKTEAYIGAFCFGDKSGLEEEVVMSMKSLGIYHVLAFSGFHVIILLSFFGLLFRNKILALICTATYVFFLALYPSSLRALIMVALCLTAKKVQKRYDMLSALSASAVTLLIYRPYYLFSCGYHLSFLALIGIGCFSGIIAKELRFLNANFRKKIAVIVSAQVLIIPYCIMQFNELNIGFLLGNVIMIPFVLVVILLCFVCVFFAFIPVVGKLVLMLTKECINGLDFLVKICGKQVFGVLKVEKYCAILYLAMVFLIIYVYIWSNNFNEIEIKDERVI